MSDFENIFTRPELADFCGLCNGRFNHGELVFAMRGKHLPGGDGMAFNAHLECLMKDRPDLRPVMRRAFKKAIARSGRGARG